MSEARDRYEKRKRALTAEHQAGKIDRPQLRVGLMVAALEERDDAHAVVACRDQARQLAASRAEAGRGVAAFIRDAEAIGNRFVEYRDALRAQAEAGEITVEEFRDEAIALTKEAYRRAKAIPDAVERQRAKLHRLLAWGAPSGWATDAAGDWRYYVNVGGAWAEMP